MFKRRNSYFETEKKKNAIKWNSNIYFHNSIRWPSFWAILLGTMVKYKLYKFKKQGRRRRRRRWFACLVTFVKFSVILSMQRFYPKWFLSAFEWKTRKSILLYKRWYVHLWTPFVLLIIAKTIQNEKNNNNRRHAYNNNNNNNNTIHTIATPLFL